MNVIEEKRIKLGLTQKQLAEMLELREQHIVNGDCLIDTEKNYWHWKKY